MSSTYSNLKFELIGTGEQSGTWGSTTNTNIGTAIEQAIAGMATLSSGDFTANVCTLTLTNTNASQNARAFCIKIDAGAVSAAGTLNVPAIQKPYVIINSSSYAVTVKVTGLTGVAVPAGLSTVVYNNGTDVVAAISSLGALTLSGALTVTSGGASITGNSSVTGQLTTTDNVGIGRPTHANYRAIIRGIGTTSATKTLVLENSSGTETVIADDAGNVGLGVTPSAWISAYRVIDVGTSLSLQGRTDSTIDNSFVSNGYRNSGGSWIYKTTNQAFHYSHDANGHVFERAVSGAAGGTISWITDAIIDTSGNLLPGTNGTQAFGSTSLRWSQVWCTAGAFNTSDATLKTPLRTMQEAELAAGYQMAQELGTFQWLESVKEKGDKARRHVGLTVQRAAEIMESHGLDPWAYGFMGFDKWEAVTEIVDATEADDGAYQEQVTRQKTKKQTNQQNAVEIINGKPTLKVETVESDVPVTEQIQVVDADGKPVFIDVPEVPAVLDEEGHVVTPAVPAHQVPMLHAVPVMETATVWKRIKEVRPAGESYAFRSDQLAFFIAAGVAARGGA